MTVMICIMVMNHSELVSIPRTALSYDNRYVSSSPGPRLSRGCFVLFML